MNLTRIADQLVTDVRRLRFAPPVTHVYNPLEYARPAYDRYTSKYGRTRRDVILVGMNPGPWGMVQSGVPFGDVVMVRDWLGIEAPVGKPKKEHPKRPVLGFACSRREVSGQRIWGWARDHFTTPKRFFERFFIANYCPLAFLEASGRNRTPDKLPAAERQPLLSVCDRALKRTVEHFRPQWVIGIGRFAETRAKAALADLDVAIGHILHPSPASPAANHNWPATASNELRNLGIDVPQVMP